VALQMNHRLATLLFGTALAAVGSGCAKHAYQSNPVNKNASEYKALSNTANAECGRGVFVNGVFPSDRIGVVEYPAGSSKCSKLPLKVKEHGYPAGLGVDPKTDDLIVEDLLGCAGGENGRITVYERPYGSRIIAKHFLHASCPGGFRLDAASSRILFTDSLVGLRGPQVHGCGGAWVDQRSYPGTKGRSKYTSGCSSAITTIPNTLPN
jgi:hypothetical protein